MLGYNIGQSSFFTRNIVSIASSKGTEGSAPGTFGASLFLCSDYIIALWISTVKGESANFHTGFIFFDKNVTLGCEQ